MDGRGGQSLVLVFILLLVLAGLVFINFNSPGSLHGKVIGGDLPEGGNFYDSSDDSRVLISSYFGYFFKKGDLNKDGLITESDLVFLTDYMFSGGPAPNPLGLADANSDNRVDVSDQTFLSKYVFNDGPFPFPLLLKRGDFDQNGLIDQSDIAFLNDYANSGGPAPNPLGLADANSDNRVDVADSVFLSKYVFSDGPSPGYYFFKKGDLNKDGLINQEDLDFFADYANLGGPAPNPLGLADANSDNRVDVSDQTFLSKYVFNDGPSPEYYFLMKGDLNKDGLITESDLVFLTDYMFSGGPAPNPLWLGDIDENGLIDIGDSLLLRDYIYGKNYLPVQECDPDLEIEYYCNGTISFICNSEGMLVEQGEIEGICGFSSGEDPENPDSSSNRPDIVIYSPQEITYSKTTILLSVGDKRGKARYWKYSLNEGSEIEFDPDINISVPIGLNNLVVYASKYSSFSSQDSEEVNFLVSTPNIRNYCGDNICDVRENCFSCSTDCGSCRDDPDPSIFCGDGIREGSEECDDGNTKNGDGCSVNCRIEDEEESSSFGWLIYVLIGGIVGGIILLFFILFKRHKFPKDLDFGNKPNVQIRRPPIRRDFGKRY
ncbi:MAG: dockerin type I domain-containing protein [archaeon]